MLYFRDRSVQQNRLYNCTESFNFFTVVGISPYILIQLLANTSNGYLLPLSLGLSLLCEGVEFLPIINTVARTGIQGRGNERKNSLVIFNCFWFVVLFVSWKILRIRIGRVGFRNFSDLTSNFE
jgi:hypothetical protein